MGCFFVSLRVQLQNTSILACSLGKDIALRFLRCFYFQSGPFLIASDFFGALVKVEDEEKLKYAS